MKKLSILLITLIFYLSSISFSYASNLIRIGLRNNQYYYLDKESVVCDIYAPPEYRLHGTIITKDVVTDDYVGESIYFFRYNYNNNSMYYVEYTNSISTEIECIKTSPSNQMVIKTTAGLEMFSVAYGECFPF